MINISNIKKYQIKLILIILITLSSSIGAYFSKTPPSAGQVKNFEIESDVKYEVTKVVDGDTFKIKIKGQTVTVRMLGIDTPETVDPRKQVQCFGKEASNKAKELLLKNLVTLQTDPTQGITDKFNRILAYVYRDDDIFINKYLIENGFAHEYTYNIPYEKQSEFREAERSAREAKVGLWGSLCLKK